ncbi:MAG TPA: LanC-like protein [Gaiellaceae bacterium]|nr:LanC-like protein [Gaiellaceae bacterium]
MAVLFRVEEHEPLRRHPWDAGRVRAAIGEIVAATEAAVLPDGLWPLHPDDRESDDEPDSYTGIYLGAAGVAWALGRLGSRTDVRTAVERAYARWPESPELDGPGVALGESGFLRILESPRLPEVVRANAANKSNEYLLGAPGTMLAAESAPGCDEAWRESADVLWSRWDGPVWMQHLYGQVVQYLGAGHGFAGNVRALAGRPDLLGEERLAELERRTVEVLADQALRDGDRVNWSPLHGDPRPEQIRVQWCHGAPGVITSCAGLAPGSGTLTELLVAGGELVWHAGPLRKGGGICHGTGGNGWAFLKLHARTGDRRWLERARAFAMHALEQVDGARFSLFTGDLGIALYLQACIDVDDRWPTIDVW